MKNFLSNEYVKSYGPYLLGFLVLSLIYIFKNKTTEKVAYPTQSTQKARVMVSLIAVPKGTRINPQLCQSVGVDFKKLTPQQRLNLITEEKWQSLDIPLYAKKDIPPHKVLFWNELRFGESPQVSVQMKNISRPQVIYSDKGSP